MSTLNATTFRKAYEEYFTEKKALGMKETTEATYRLHINHFINSDNSWDMNTCLLTKDWFLWWIEDLREDENKADVTVTSYARTVRAWIYWLQDNDYCDTFKLELPSYKKTIKRTYTDEELKILLEKPAKDCSEVEYQTWVYINLLISTGLRLSSLLNVKVCDFIRKEKYMYVDIMKNDNPRVVYLNAEVCSILNKYIALFELEETDYFFCTAQRTRLAKRTIQDNVAEYNRSKGIEKTSIHLFRHTFAKNYYLQTKDIYALCRVLNHSSISTTELYLRDLGLDSETSTAYNPQQQYLKENKRRRGKIKH